MQSFLKLIQWSVTGVKKVKEIDLRLKNMWILWINVISILVADIMVLSLLLEIQQQILRWQDSLFKTDGGSLMNACELIKWVTFHCIRKYFTVSQVIRDMEGNKM